jgi:hypothetical protein
MAVFFEKVEKANPIRMELVLHVGPAKCGSSSIQNFFANEKEPCVQKTRFILLNPFEISDLNCEQPSESLLEAFAERLSKNITEYDSLILSHEFLFQNPYTIKNICCLAEKLTLKVSIIGYCRRQSDFMVSAYSQWLFRSPERISETTKTLKAFGLDPLLFTGLESFVIASVINDFYSARQLSEYSILDWHKSYKKISHLIPGPGPVIKCGVLPGENSEVPLIQDFCAKAGLTLHSRTKKALQNISNKSFDQDVVEAINKAVTYGITIAGPHDNNAVIERLSSKMSPADKKPSAFLSDLKSYTDTCYLESNQKLCRQYGLDPAYFEPSKRVSRQEILDSIIHEAYQRSLNTSAVIETYRILSAKMVELCFTLAKEG